MEMEAPFDGLLVDAIKHDNLTANRNHITDNLTKDEQALRNLKKRQEILNNQTC